MWIVKARFLTGAARLETITSSTSVDEVNGRFGPFDLRANAQSCVYSLASRPSVISAEIEEQKVDGE